MRNADMPAMTSGALYDDAAQDVIPHRGITKREYFAGLAMQGLCSTIQHPEYDHGLLANLAVKQADALLAALEDSNQ